MLSEKLPSLETYSTFRDCREHGLNPGKARQACPGHRSVATSAPSAGTATWCNQSLLQPLSAPGLRQERISYFRRGAYGLSARGPKHLGAHYEIYRLR